MDDGKQIKYSINEKRVKSIIKKNSEINIPLTN